MLVANIVSSFNFLVAVSLITPVVRYRIVGRMAKAPCGEQRLIRPSMLSNAEATNLLDVSLRG